MLKESTQPLLLRKAANCISAPLAMEPIKTLRLPLNMCPSEVPKPIHVQLFMRPAMYPQPPRSRPLSSQLLTAGDQAAMSPASAAASAAGSSSGGPPSAAASAGSLHTPPPKLSSLERINTVRCVALLVLDFGGRYGRPRGLSSPLSGVKSPKPRRVYRHVLMKGGFICLQCRMTCKTKEDFTRSECLEGRCHRVTQADYQCSHCYQVSNDIENFKLAACPRTRRPEPEPLPAEAPVRTALPPQPHKSEGHSQPVNRLQKRTLNLETPTNPKTLVPNSNESAVAPAQAEAIPADKVLSPTHADNLALQLALEEAKAELEKLVILRSLESERDRLRQLMLKKAEEQTKQPLICA